MTPKPRHRPAAAQQKCLGPGCRGVVRDFLAGESQGWVGDATLTVRAIEMPRRLPRCEAADRPARQAVLHAVGRADALLEEGDFEGATVWRRILGAIKELQRAREPDEAMN